MQKKDSTRKRPSVALIIAAVVFYKLISFADLDTWDGVLMVMILLMLALPVFLGLWIFRTIRKKASPGVHTHDRVDHTRDLKIDTRTGKAVSAPVRQVQAHTPQEHWKQQLDQLLANGTIDRAEYKAMLKHRF